MIRTAYSVLPAMRLLSLLSCLLPALATRQDDHLRPALVAGQSGLLMAGGLGPADQSVEVGLLSNALTCSEVEGVGAGPGRLCAARAAGPALGPHSRRGGRAAATVWRGTPWHRALLPQPGRGHLVCGLIAFHISLDSAVKQLTLLGSQGPVCFTPGCSTGAGSARRGCTCLGLPSGP